jgi:hypothetical protein
VSEEIFREVDDDLRQDQYLKLWKQYGRFLIGAAVGVIVATAAWQGYAAWERSRNESYSERFIAALQMLNSGQPGAAITTLETLEKDAHDGYATLAKLQRAGAMIQAGDRREAVSLYDAIANDTAVERPLRDLAAYMAAQSLLDTADEPTLERRLLPLNQDGNPWRFNARELLALTALRAGNIVKAREYYALLTDDPATPQAIRTRAAEMLAAMA